MKRGISLYSATEYYRPFPKPEAVFADRVDDHAMCLLPLGTLALSELNARWDGHIHLVMPIEPAPGWGAFDRSTAYHTYLCRSNCLGYRLIDGKLSLDCDFRLFHRAYLAAHPPRDELEVREAAQLPGFYAESAREFGRRRDFFQRSGYLSYSCTEGVAGAERASLVNDLGGLGYFDYSDCSSLPWTQQELPDSTDLQESGIVRLPLTEDGRAFHYIGSVEQSHYLGNGNGALGFFYDPEERVVLSIYNWS